MIFRNYRPAILALISIAFHLSAAAQERFPDGSAIPDWFRKNEATDINRLGKSYRITDYAVGHDSTVVQTRQIQAVIDKAAANGGGVIVIPKGCFPQRVTVL